MKKKLSFIFTVIAALLLFFFGPDLPIEQEGIGSQHSRVESADAFDTESVESAGSKETDAGYSASEVIDSEALDPDGWYYSKEEVALYIHTYGCLPSNFITKEEAGDLGWEGGSVEKFAPGYAIGGDLFGNREGQLPKGHTYYECDIDTNGYHSRGSRRIVFSEDGLIYYTHDHYESFELLYGEE